MSVETTYSSLRQNLASVLERADNDNEVFIVRRRKGRDIALIPADELSSLLETAHLLRDTRKLWPPNRGWTGGFLRCLAPRPAALALLSSPANAKRLLRALRRADNRAARPATIDDLRKSVGLERKI